MTDPGALEIEPRAVAARRDDFEVVDVRAPHELAGPLGRVPGARAIPLAELEARAGELHSPRCLLLVCRSGMRSRRACELLLAHGVGPVANLTGGMIAWNRAGLAIEETKPASLSALLDSVVAWVAQVGARDRAAVCEELELATIGDGAAFDRMLERLETRLRRADAPADLDLSLAAFRRWRAEL